MKKMLLFAVLLLTLTLLPTVPIVAKKPPHTPGPAPPPKGEIYLVTFTGPDIISGYHTIPEPETLELMSSGARGKGGKHLAVYTPQGEYSTLTFIEDVDWGVWEGPHVGKIRLSIDLKFKEVDMIYFFDYEHEPLDFWRLKSTDEGKGEWIPDKGKVCFSDDPFEIWLYSEQGVTTTLWLTFDVTIEPKP